MFPEDDPNALRKALARLIDPDGTRFITYIRLEASLHEPPLLEVREWVRPETLKDLEEIVSHYRIVPESDQSPASKDGFLTVKKALIASGIVRLEKTEHQEFPVIADEEAFKEFVDGVNVLVRIIQENTKDIQPPTTGET